MSLLCPHLIHLWCPWQGIGKSPRRQVALKRHSTHGTEISLDDIDAEFARDNHCLTLCMYILCIYNVARASGNAQCACSCIYYACTCTYVHVHIPNVLVILYGRSAAIFPTDTQISRFPHYDSRIQSRVTHTRPKCLVQQPHILGQNVVYLSTVYTSSSERASRGPTMKDTYLSRCLWCVRCLRQGIPWRQDPQNSHFRVARTREVLGNSTVVAVASAMQDTRTENKRLQQEVCVHRQEIASLRTHMSALELEAELRDFWHKEFKEVRYVGNDTFVVAYTLRL